jgi:hypothetical protein
MHKINAHHIQIIWLLIPTLMHLILNLKNTWYERDSGTAQVSILSTVFFGFSAVEKTSSQYPWLPAVILSFGALFALASLHETNLKIRVALSWAALCSIISAVTILIGNEHAKLMFSAFSATHMLFIMTQYLIGYLEREIEANLSIGQVWGLAQHFPRISGLLLASLVLLGCAPGSILFITEDLILHFVSMYSVYAVVLVFVISIASGVALYQGYLEIFTGQDLTMERRFSVKREEPALRLVVATLLFTLVLGLCPSLFC